MTLPMALEVTAIEPEYLPGDEPEAQAFNLAAVSRGLPIKAHNSRDRLGLTCYEAPEDLMNYHVPSPACR